jgi:hypothetical protein
MGMYGNDDKRKLRNLKKALKRKGNKHRRNTLKRQLRQDPQEAHLAEEDLGGSQFRDMNRLDRPVDGSD